MVAGPNGAGKTTFVDNVLRRAAPRLETVFSHQSKVELVQAGVDAGYSVSLHVLIIPLEVAIARVAERVEHGGHDVPNDKMHERYARLWELIAEAIGIATESVVWDSSGFSSFTKVATFAGGRRIGDPRWPVWAPAPLVALA